MSGHPRDRVAMENAQEPPEPTIKGGDAPLYESKRERYNDEDLQRLLDELARRFGVSSEEGDESEIVGAEA